MLKERYKKFFKETSGYVVDFIDYCKINKIVKPTLKNLDDFVAYRGITDFTVIQTIAGELEKDGYLMPSTVKVS